MDATFKVLNLSLKISGKFHEGFNPPPLLVEFYFWIWVIHFWWKDSNPSKKWGKKVCLEMIFKQFLVFLVHVFLSWKLANTDPILLVENFTILFWNLPFCPISFSRRYLQDFHNHLWYLYCSVDLYGDQWFMYCIQINIKKLMKRHSQLLQVGEFGIKKNVHLHFFRIF